MKPRWFLLLALIVAVPVEARVSVEVCFNYGCARRATVMLDDTALARVERLFASVADPAAEREAIALAVAKLYSIAGGQSPIVADRAGNLRDGEVDGRMDCIDHSTTTTRWLLLIEGHEWLRFHRVRDPARRSRLIFQHFSAVIEEARPLVPARLASKHGAIPDHVPMLLAMCDCKDVLDDLSAEDAEGAADSGQGERFAVDSWFVDHGAPAVILPLAEWLKGGGPNVQ